MNPLHVASEPTVSFNGTTLKINKIMANISVPHVRDLGYWSQITVEAIPFDGSQHNKDKITGRRRRR